MASDAPRDDWKPPFEAKWRVDRLAAGPWTVSTALPEAPLEAPAIVYPLDRNARTPLVAFCPVDVLRSTLGLGPCQYVLQTEGLVSVVRVFQNRPDDGRMCPTAGCFGPPRQVKQHVHRQAGD